MSRGEVDLFKYIKATYNYLLDKNLIVDYLKVLVKEPISKFDEKEVKKVIKKVDFK